MIYSKKIFFNHATDFIINAHQVICLAGSFQSSSSVKGIAKIKLKLEMIFLSTTYLNELCENTLF